ncbi:Scaffolding protein [Levilactobacillus brevis KB290]|uniref:Scaffolding protein n=1 Tax=Levilactobacillus brevis KB290 TaxID=1001583 RepID=M5AHG4_LEVBR|nr:phage scaffolding protein [Levilactobacillus brevis]BAN07787.1 Scaffolding protein [Levilactobacillus brevis KB290]
MKRDLLKGMNLTDDQIEAIMKANGVDIEAAKSSLGDVDALKQENDTLKEQLTTRDKDMKALKKQVADNEDLTKQVTDLQAKYDNDTKALSAQLNQTKLTEALNTALSGAKARNPKTVEALLDMDKIQLEEDGKLTGLDDQLAAIKKDNEYLFDEGSNTNYEPGGGNGSNDSDQVQTLVDAFK